METNPATTSEGASGVDKTSDKDGEAAKSVKPASPSWTNPITILGLLFVGSGLILLLTFWLFQAISRHGGENQYLNVVGFMILPGVLINGLIMCPIGIAIRRWRQRRGLVGRITTRQAMIFLAVTFFLIIPVLGVGGYE